MQNAGLDEAQARIKAPRTNINNLRYADDTTHMSGIEEEPKSLLMNVKEESGKKKKNCLKIQHVHPWLIHVNVWQKPLQYCKVISLHLK